MQIHPDTKHKHTIRRGLSRLLAVGAVATAGLTFVGVGIASAAAAATTPISGIKANTTTLPGISTLGNLVGSLLDIGLIAALAGLIIAAIVWSLGHHSSNPQLAGRGKSGVLVAMAAAVLLGGAVTITQFFFSLGGRIV